MGVRSRCVRSPRADRAPPPGCGRCRAGRRGAGAARAQQLAPVLAAPVGRAGGAGELLDKVEETGRVAVEGEVARALEDLQPAARHGLVRAVRVSHRHHAVPVAPEQHRGHALGQIAAVEHGHRLPAPVDDRPQGADERAAGGRVGQRVDEVEQLRRVLAQIGVQEPHQTQEQADLEPHAGQPQRGEHEVGARQRDGPQYGVDLAAYAARADQDQPFGALRELVGELHGDTAAERVPDQGGGLDVERGEQIADPVGVRGHRVVGARLVGGAVAEQVGRDHRVGACEVGDQVRPGRRGVADAVDQDERGALTGHAVGTTVAVHDAVLQTQLRVAHGAQPRVAPRTPRRYVDHGLTSCSGPP